MDSFARSWELAKASGRVLWADKELLWFPVLSTLVTAPVWVILVGLWLTLAGIPAAITQGGNVTSDQSWLGWGVVVISHLVSSLSITFFTSALVGAALIRLRGGDPTLRDGLGIAVKHLSPILVFGLISGTVGLLISLIRGNRRGARGAGLAMVARGLQAAWSLATFLAIPLMVSRPDMNAIDALKESTRLLKRTWGEQIIGRSGISLVFFVPVAVVLVGGIVLTVVLVNANQGTAALVVMISMFVLLVLLSVIQTALTGIYKAAVYLYAAEQVETEVFNPTLVRGAFEPSAS